ncbi:F-box only protein 4 isoform X2 [Engraulis encrasicolus]
MVVAAAEPRFAMFGPGLEQLEACLVLKLLNSPDILPVTGASQTQIRGIGSGITFAYGGLHKFSIFTLHSTNRAERERARLERVDVQNRLFTQREDEVTGRTELTIAPNLLEVCQTVEGFIFATNAETEHGGGSSEAKERDFAQIRAMLVGSGQTPPRPLLVLSCTSREAPECPRFPCLKVAQWLSLSQLPNPWMVQDTVVESLSGLLDGIQWLLRQTGTRL